MMSISACNQEPVYGIWYREELQKEPILAITELEFEDSIGSNLRHRSQPPCLEELSNPRNKRRRSRSSCSCKVSQMAAKASIDNELFLVIRFREFKQEDLGREVVYVGESQRHQALLELVSDDLS